MKHALPVLILLVGLGGHISFSQSDEQSPFDQYLIGLKTHHRELALIRFAGDCGVDTNSILPRYAQSPDNDWILVKDLSNALKDLDTDFYATVAVWHARDRIMVEQWGMELDTGTYSRQFVCLKNQRIMLFEGIDWTIPPVMTNEQRALNPAWGYEQRWKAGPDGNYQKVLSRFVDVNGQPMKEPSLDRETKSDLDWKWQVHSWHDLKLPDALLR